MGVKSTVTLTRAEAEERYVRLRQERAERRANIKARTKLVTMTDKQLEDDLEELNDARYEDGQGGFENYLVTR